MSQVLVFSRKVKLAKACEIMGVCRNTILNWHQAGRIKLLKGPTGRWFVEIRELERVQKEVRS